MTEPEALASQLVVPNQLDLTGSLTLFKALADPTRLRTVALLAEGELSVSELTQCLGQSQPRISRHLKILAEAGLVERQPEGAWVFYRLVDQVVGGLAGYWLARLQRDHGVLRQDRLRRDQAAAARQEAAATYFRDNAAHWHEISRLYGDQAVVDAALRAAVGPERIGCLVDGGTGTGHVLGLFRDQVDLGYGIDLSAEMLALARARLLIDDQGQIRLRQADLTALPLVDHSADVVILHQVLHYLERPASAIGEAARVLKAGGLLLLVDLAAHRDETLRERHRHRRLGFTADEIAQVCSQAGLVVDSVQSLTSTTVRSGERLTILLWRATKHVAPDHAPASAKERS